MFGIQDKILAMAGGALSALLGIALLFVLISKNAEISSLKDSIHNPKTGWAARLTAAERNLSTCRLNEQTQATAIERQNASIADWKAKAETNAAQAAAELAEVRHRNQPALARVERLGQATPGADACMSADALILQSLGE